MTLTLFNSEYNYSFDGEKIFLQFLLVTFSLSFIYIACRSMKIVERKYEKTTKKMTKLRATVEVVLAHHKPVCQNVLTHSLMKHRRSLVASYLNDLMKENQFEHDKCSNFFQNFQESLPKKQTISLMEHSDKFDSISRLGTKAVFEKESTSDVNGSGELIISQEKKTKNTCQIEESKVKCRKNELKIVRRPLESKLFKTLECPNRRLRSTIFEKRKSKIPKRNLTGLNTMRGNENVTVCTVLTETNSPFRVKRNINMAKHCKSTSMEERSELMKNDSSVIENQVIRNDKENENFQKEEKSTMDNASSANTMEDCSVSVCSARSSGCESDCESDLTSSQTSSQITFSNGSVRQNTPLTTINEESAEEMCPSE